MQHLIIHLPFEDSKSSKLQERFNTRVADSEMQDFY